jgi:hypothetical protein
MRRAALAYGVATFVIHIWCAFAVMTFSIGAVLNHQPFGDLRDALAILGATAIVIDAITAGAVCILILMRWTGRDISQYIGEKI